MIMVASRRGLRADALARGDEEALGLLGGEALAGPSLGIGQAARRDFPIYGDRGSPFPRP
jgi:hypothetical protein